MHSVSDFCEKYSLKHGNVKKLIQDVTKTILAFVMVSWVWLTIRLRHYSSIFYQRAPGTEMQDSSADLPPWNNSVGLLAIQNWPWVEFSIKYSKHLASTKEILKNGLFPILINNKILSVRYLKFLLLAQFCWFGKLKIFSVLATNI